jgi:hypothetical protein
MRGDHGVRKTAVHLLSSVLHCGGYAVRVRFSLLDTLIQRCNFRFQQFNISNIISKLRMIMRNLGVFCTKNCDPQF